MSADYTIAHRTTASKSRTMRDDIAA